MDTISHPKKIYHLERGRPFGVLCNQIVKVRVIEKSDKFQRITSFYGQKTLEIITKFEISGANPIETN